MSKAHFFLAYILTCTFVFWWPAALSVAEIIPVAIPPILIMVGALAMVIGTVVFAATDGGLKRVGQLFLSVIDVRHGPKWWLIALVPALCLLIAQLAYGYGARPDGFAFLTLTAFIPITVLIEEFVWRGYAQPKLQETHGLLTTGLILSGVWLVFHLPFYILPNYNPWGFAGYFAWAPWYVIFMLFFTWLGAHTRCSIFLAVVSHALVNWVGTEWFDPPAMENFGALGGAVLLAVIVIMAFRNGKAQPT